MKKRFNLVYYYFAIATALAIFSLVAAYSNLVTYLEEYHLYLFLAYLIFGFALRIPAQISIAAGLVLLLGTPIINLRGGEDLAKRVIVYAFYFLSIGLIWAIADYMRTRLKKLEKGT